jgi:Hemerythrin HHE cation binding domain
VETALAALGELRATVEHAADPAASTPRLAAERYVASATELCRDLLHHLDDEEHLVVPLLERADAGVDARGRATQEQLPTTDASARR